MTSRIFTLISSVAFLATLFFISSAPSVYHAPENSGGQSTTNCGGCHGNSTGVGSSFTISGIPATYTPGQVYNGSVCLTNTSQVAGGFTLWQDNGGGSFQVGAFNITDAGTQTIGAFLTHNAARVFDGSSTACWSFSWNAPAVGGGNKLISAAGNAVNNTGNTAGDHGGFQTMVASAEGALPVDLIDFSVEEKNEAAILLWQTATEINNDRFVIERSFDVREWEVIGEVQGQGNSEEREQYSFTDTDLPKNRTVFYRLKQMDFDGAFEYSLVQKIMIEQALVEVSKVYPNPIFRSENLKVDFEVKENLREVDLIVTDMIGHSKFTQTYNVSLGQNTLEVPVVALPAGQYFVSLNAEGQRIVGKSFIVTQ